MPLPAALAARLAKRGLLKKDEREEVEEVFAEDYDVSRRLRPVASLELEPEETVEENDSEEVVHECLACPNRTNTYHACVEYCKKRWGFKKFKPDPELVKRHERLLSKYPPPSGWVEVGDPETSRFYYWNLETDEVSWLPPQHPRANVSLSAERLRELKLTADRRQAEERDRDSQGESSADESTDLDDEDDIDEDKEEFEEPEQMDKKRGKKRQREALDPMDPAAYSDVPRGNWSTGLDQRGSAKTGVDVTVSGPLFQQRPYPSPGAVLRMNKDSKGKEPPKGKEIIVKKP